MSIIRIKYFIKHFIETHLQKVNILETNENNKYYSTLINKLIAFLSHSKHHVEAEKEFFIAISYDSECKSTHYYLRKYLDEYEHNYNKTTTHSNKYITVQLPNKKMSNKSHLYQILAEMPINNIYKNYRQSQCCFNKAIQCTELSNCKLPKWIQYVGENTKYCTFFIWLRIF